MSKRHHQLSTYNIGTEFSKKEWQYLTRQFIQQGLILQDAEYGSLKLTPKAYAVFKGEQVMGILPPREVPAARQQLQIANDPVLFNLLRAKRKELAQLDNVPPYVIFSDRALVEMAAYFPQSRTTFAAVHGVGQAKLEKYTDHFLPIIQAYCEANDIAEKPRQTTKRASPARRIAAAGINGRTEEVVSAFNNGQSVPELAQAMGIKQNTILEHLWKGMLAKRPLRSDNLLSLSTLSPDVQKQAIAAFNELGTDYLRPVFDALNETVSYDELKIIRLYVAICNINDG